MRRLLLASTLTLLAAGTPAPGTPADTVAARLVEDARRQAAVPTVYDPAYVRLAYPGGDVSADRGVCTDVIVRALRAVGVDLQVLIHEEMKAEFDAYPRNWGLERPDPNIDHRRVPNQMTFLRRNALALPLEEGREIRRSFRPGDLVYWKLPGGIDHCGIVTDRRGPSGNFQVVHNLGEIGEEDCLTTWRVIGHFRYPREA